MEESEASTEIEVVDGSAVEVDETAEVPAARKRTGIWQHPDRDTIHYLIRHGKSAYWIQCWLEERYPLVVEDDDGDEVEHDDAALHRRWQVAASTIDTYRADWMPECAPGVDVVSDEITELIGRRLPGAAKFELEVLEAGVHVAQVNLARALRADEDLGMLQQSTLEANDAMMKAANQMIAAKAKLQVDGYEPAPERTINENINTNTNRNLSVELHGKLGKDGKVLPGNPEAVEAMKQLMGMSAEERQQVIEAGRTMLPEAEEAQYDDDGHVIKEQPDDGQAT